MQISAVSCGFIVILFPSATEGISSDNFGLDSEQKCQLTLFSGPPNKQPKTSRVSPSN